MEYVMGPDMRRVCLDESDEVMSFDWESLGRLVRRRALYAVALHFAACAEVAAEPPGDAEADSRFLGNRS